MPRAQADFEHLLNLPWEWRSEYDEEDDAWVVTIVDWPDFFAVGDTEQEAMVNAREALLSHAASYARVGRQLPLPRRRYVPSAPVRAYQAVAFFSESSAVIG